MRPARDGAGRGMVIVVGSKAPLLCWPIFLLLQAFVSEPPDDAFTEIESSQSNGGLRSTQAAANIYCIRKCEPLHKNHAAVDHDGLACHVIGV